MNKQEYLEALNKALSGIPESEKQKTLDYYTEIIDDAMEEGEEEASIIARLDAPSDIGRRLIDETPLRKFVTEDVKKHKIDNLTAILLNIIPAVGFTVAGRNCCDFCVVYRGVVVGYFPFCRVCRSCVFRNCISFDNTVCVCRSGA